MSFRIFSHVTFIFFGCSIGVSPLFQLNVSIRYWAMLRVILKRDKSLRAIQTPGCGHYCEGSCGFLDKGFTIGIYYTSTAWSSLLRKASLSQIPRVNRYAECIAGSPPEWIFTVSVAKLEVILATRRGFIDERDGKWPIWLSSGFVRSSSFLTVVVPTMGECGVLAPFIYLHLDGERINWLLF